MKKKPVKIGSLKAKAWKLFSEYIRRKNSKNGYCTCVTCGTTLPWREMQAGHFVGGRSNAVLFEEEIVHCQCVKCNVFLGGNYANYTLFMIDMYGREETEKYLAKKQEIVKRTKTDYLDLIEELTEKLKDLGE